MNINDLSVSKIREVEKLFNPFSGIEELERYDRYVKKLEPILDTIHKTEDNRRKNYTDRKYLTKLYINAISYNRALIYHLQKTTPRFNLDTIVKYWIKKGKYDLRILDSEYQFYTLDYLFDTVELKREYYNLGVIVEYFNVKIDMYDAYQRIKQRVINGRSEPISQHLSDEYERYLHFINNYIENHQYDDPPSDFHGLQIEKKFKLKSIIEIFIKIECRFPHDIIQISENYRYLLDYFIER